MNRNHDHSGLQMDAIRAAIPHANRKTKGKKIRAWISHRPLDCLYSLLCKNASKKRLFIMARISFEKAVVPNIDGTLKNFLEKRPLVSSGIEPDNQYDKSSTIPAAKRIRAAIVVVSPAEKVAA